MLLQKWYVLWSSIISGSLFQSSCLFHLPSFHWQRKSLWRYPIINLHQDVTGIVWDVIFLLSFVFLLMVSYNSLQSSGCGTFSKESQNLWIFWFDYVSLLISGPFSRESHNFEFSGYNCWMLGFSWYLV